MNNLFQIDPIIIGAFALAIVILFVYKAFRSHRFSPQGKVLFVTIAPALLFLLVLVVLSLWDLIVDKNNISSGMPVPIELLLLSVWLICFWQFWLILYYIRHVVTNPRLEIDKKVFWILAILCVHTLGMLVYWKHYLREDQKA